MSREEIVLAQERQQRQQADILRKIGMTLSAILDFDELLDLLLDQLALIMPDDSVEIVFVMGDISRMVRQRKRPSLDIIKYDITDVHAPTFFIAKTRNQRHIIDSGEPLLIPDIQQFEGWLQTNHISDQFHAWVGVPLFVNNSVQAILAVYSREVDKYSAADVEQLSAFARQSELAIQNAMLYQSTKRRLDELTTLQELTALAAAATNVDDLITQATAIIQKIFYTGSFGILLVNASGTRLELHASYHSSEYNTDFSSISVDRGITGYVYRTGETVCVGNVRGHLHFVRVDESTHSELCVPLRADGRVLGVINVESVKRNAYSPDDERLMATIADQLATAVVKIRLLAREKQRQQETEALRLAGNALVASLSLDEVLKTILIELGKLIHFDSSGVLLLDGEELLFAAGHGFSPHIQQHLVGQSFPFRENTLTVKMMRQLVPTVIDDIRRELTFNFWGGTTYIRGWMGAPLIARGEIIGFLTTDSRQVGAYGERDKQIIQAFANQAAIAIENARLYEVEKKARETAVILRKAAMELSASHDLNIVLDQMLGSLAELVDYDSTNVMLLENQTLVQKALRGYEKWTDVQQVWKIRFDIGKNNGFTTIFRKGQSYIIDDTAIAPDWKKTATNGHIRSWLGVPLYAGGSIVGIISLDKNEPHFFTQNHVQLVESLAAQTAVIIQNAIYFNEMKKIGTLLHILNATPCVIDALPVLIPLINSAVNCQFASISIFDDRPNRRYTHYSIADNDESTVHMQKLEVSDTAVSDKVLQGDTAYLPDLSLATSHAVEQERYKTGTRSRIILPLIAGTEVIGSLNLGWAAANGYDLKKMPLFRRIASVIALAVERGDLYEQSRRQESELETLFSVSTAMRLAVTISDVLNELIRHVKTIIQPLFAGVLLAEESTGDLVAYGELDNLPPDRQRIPRGKGISGHVFNSGEVYISAKLAEDPLTQLLPQDLVYLPQLGGSITLPLQTQERIIGVIHIGLRVEHKLDGAETRLLTSIAEIASSALDRAMVLETLEQRVDERTQALTLANQRLTELDRLKSKFVSDISHELRTPITNLGLYVQLMQRGDAEKQAHYLKVLYMQSERLKALVEDILSLSRLERTKGELGLTAVNPNNIITQVIESRSIQSKIGELTLTTMLHPNLPSALSNKNQFLQLVFNLLMNALNYTEKGGVEISTTFDAESDMICIAVADTGVGIAEQDMPYIFDHFYRGHDVGSLSIPGTGLGLSIVQKIVMMHNGRLEIESTVGEGTTIRIWLQKAQP